MVKRREKPKKVAENWHLCQVIRENAKQTYLGGMPPNLPPWVGTRLNQYGGVFGGTPPRYVRFDPPLKS